MVDDVSTVAPRGCINDRPFIFSRVDKTGIIFLLLGYAFKIGFYRPEVFNYFAFAVI
jgi:hypothetical protein